MCEHLRIAMVPYTHLPSLEEAERAMLAELDPPLNLKSMPRTPVKRSSARNARSYANGPDLFSNYFAFTSQHIEMMRADL